MDSLQQNLCAAHRSSDREGCRNKAKIGDLVWFREISASRRYQDAFGSAIPNNTILCSQRGMLSISNQTGKFDMKALYRATWELSSNYVLDRVHSSLGLSLRKILMDLPSSVFPKTPLFLLVDRKWRSSNAITFTFLPENETEARSVIAGLIPFFKVTYSPLFLHFSFFQRKQN